MITFRQTRADTRRVKHKQHENVTTGTRTFTCRLQRQTEVADCQRDARWPAIITDNRKWTTADAAFPDDVKRMNNNTNSYKRKPNQIQQQSTTQTIVKRQ